MRCSPRSLGPCTGGALPARGEGPEAGRVGKGRKPTRRAPKELACVGIHVVGHLGRLTPRVEVARAARNFLLHELAEFGAQFAREVGLHGSELLLDRLDKLGLCAAISFWIASIVAISARSSRRDRSGRVPERGPESGTDVRLKGELNELEATNGA